MDSLRILNNNKLIWLNLTGSGNESAAHVQKDSRMTIMFCAFEDLPLILRLFGTARVVHQSDNDWQALFAHFNPLPGARQVFELSIDLVLTSCGMGVPYYAYKDDRDMLLAWAEKKGDEGLKQYWQEKNQFSIDDIPTNIDADNS